MTPAGRPGSLGWYVVYTKPRQEHTALHNLVRQHYEVWLPLMGDSTGMAYQQSSMRGLSAPRRNRSCAGSA